MPVDSASALHPSDAAAAGDVLDLPLASFDASYLSGARTGLTATTYLVLGSSDAPYAP